MKDFKKAVSPRTAKKIQFSVLKNSEKWVSLLAHFDLSLDTQQNMFTFSFLRKHGGMTPIS